MKNNLSVLGSRIIRSFLCVLLSFILAASNVNAKGMCDTGIIIDNNRRHFKMNGQYLEKDGEDYGNNGQYLEKDSEDYGDNGQYLEKDSEDYGNNGHYLEKDGEDYGNNGHYLDKDSGDNKINENDFTNDDSDASDMYDDSLTLNYYPEDKKFLDVNRCKGNRDEASYIDVTNDKSFWIMAKIKNNNPHNIRNADNVRMQLDIPDKYSNEIAVTGIITCSNADPKVYKDTVIFKSDDKFRIEYDYVTHIDAQKTMKTYKDDIVLKKGLLLGFEKRDGKIPANEEIEVYVWVNIIKEKEIKKLKSTKRGKSIVKAWNLIQKHADPYYFRTRYHDTSEIKNGSIGRLRGKSYEQLKATAKKITKKYKTDYKKMQALNEYIATRVYYDYPQLKKFTKDLKLKPYDVWKYKRSICQGYANLYWTMADAIGIPCMLVYSNDHVYNAAYDKVGKRWVFMDATWCSKNSYKKTAGKTWVKDEHSNKYFDMDLDLLLRTAGHEIYTVEGILKDNAYYTCMVRSGKNRDSYADMKNWKWKIAGKKNKHKTMKIYKKIEGIPVK